jgi:hypothetical protein
MSMSPLERSIVDGSSSGHSMMLAQKHATDEMAAVFDVFSSTTLVDDIVQPTDRYYAVAFLAAEIANFSNEVRRQMLITTDPIQRLQLVLQQLHQIMSRQRAETMVASVLQKTNADQQELKIGNPTLPVWSKQIQKGTKIEYYWNDEFEWCTGTVVEDPIQIMDEIILTIYFDDDQTIHKIPFHADEKARWRPPMNQ